MLTNGSTVSQSVAFSGKEGTSYWAGEDHNANGTGLPSAGAATNSPLNELSIIWTGIPITGKTGLSFKGLLAANSTNEPWDNLNACTSGVASTNTDYIIIQYRIDGGAWTNLFRFFTRGQATGTGDRYLYEDTDNNGCGDGTELTNVFSEFTRSIPGTGATLDLQVLAYSEGSNEEWGVDNFRVFATGALPVTFTDFTAVKGNAGIQLAWATASETGNNRFEIERSTDGAAFEKIGSINGSGNSGLQHSYAYTDPYPPLRRLYYRLKQVDANGAFQYSKAVTVDNSSSGGISIFPNPVKDFLTLQGGIVGQRISVTDISGRLVLVKSIEHASETIDMKNVPPGIYFLRLPEGRTERLIRE